MNTGKSHLLLSDNSNAIATIDNSYIESEYEQVLLAIAIDSNITFENHIYSICMKISQKFDVPSVFCSSASAPPMFRVPGFIVCRQKRMNKTIK